MCIRDRFYIRVVAIPDLASPEQAALWEGFRNVWPSAGPAAKDPFTQMHAWGIPAINTLLLLSSGVTVTWAHWGLVANKRQQLIIGLMLTILLGALFLTLQVYEYREAVSYTHLDVYKRQAPSRPWDGAHGLEWTVPSPAPYHTFEDPPVFNQAEAHG